MNDAMKLILSLSLSGSFFILVLIACKRFIKDKLSRQWQYYIWLVVIARLLIPFGAELNLIGNFFYSADQILETYQSVENPPEDRTEISESASSGSNVLPGRRADSPFQNGMNLFVDNIWLIWFVIALVLIIRKITAYQSFMRYVKSGMSPVTDIRLLDELALLEERVNVKKAVDLCVNPMIASPLLTGVFHPCIVLPCTELSDKDFQYTVLHELTHYRRMDTLYKWLVQFIVCLHWFNPLVHLMEREITKACEFSCDESVISRLDFKDKQDYGKTLLNAMCSPGKYEGSGAAVTLSEDKELLKERLGAIMNFGKNTKIMAISAAVITLIFCAGVTVMGAYLPIPGKVSVYKAKEGTAGNNPESNPGKITEDVPVIGAENKQTVSISQALPSADIKSATTDEAGIALIRDTGTWGADFEHLLPDMSQKAIEDAVLIYINSHIFPGISTQESIDKVRETVTTAYPYLTDQSIENLENIFYVYQADNSRQAVLPEEKISYGNTESPSGLYPSSNHQYGSFDDADGRGLAIIEDSGTWGSEFERLLPYMSQAGIEEAVNLYVEKHIFHGVSAPESISQVEKTLSAAYPYMADDSVERVKQRIEELR